eukprot:569661-Amphidinium_carterae.1
MAPRRVVFGTLFGTTIAVEGTSVRANAPLGVYPSMAKLEEREGSDREEVEQLAGGLHQTWRNRAEAFLC